MYGEKSMEEEHKQGVSITMRIGIVSIAYCWIVWFTQRLWPDHPWPIMATIVIIWVLNILYLISAGVSK